MKRRDFLSYIGLTALGVSGCRYIPTEGIFNPCLSGLPEHLKNHDLVKAAWEGIDAKMVWDCHCHLIGAGDSDSGIWVNPNMQSLLHPIQFSQFKFYMDASCANVDDKNPSIDQAYVNRLRILQQGLKPGTKFMLLAFEYYHNEKGERHREYSAFHTPNEYAAIIAKRYPDQFEWIGSIHPYRGDAVVALKHAINNEAKAIKWLPGAMGIDPESPKCDAFYEVLAQTKVPLLVHSGSEHAVEVEGGQTLNNPLLLRRALDHGVRVIFAHCASMGESIDVDKGENGPWVRNIKLFERLMAESKYEGRIYGDISAITQVNRDPETIALIVEHDDWYNRLVFGTDYPLPGVMPVFSTQNFVDWGYIKESDLEVLSEIRKYNPILYDFILKRSLTIKGKKFSNHVFESRRVFDPA